MSVIFKEIVESEVMPPNDAITIPVRVPRLQDVSRTTQLQSDMQEIIPYVFIGDMSYTTASSLRSTGIKHVLLACTHSEVTNIEELPDIKYLKLSIHDTEAVSVIPHFRVTHQFIRGALSLSSRVLVSSRSAISRAPTLVMSYLMAEYGLTYKQAFHIVNKRRPCSKPSSSFHTQLLEYEPILLATRHSNGGHSLSGQARRATTKRSVSPELLPSDNYSIMYDSSMLPNVRDNSCISAINTTSRETIKTRIEILDIVDNLEGDSISRTSETLGKISRTTTFNVCGKKANDFNSNIVYKYSTEIEAMDI